MRRALISDIHGNLAALEAVLKDIESHAIREIYCLGDIVDGSPNSLDCVDRVMKTCTVALMGNRDRDAIAGSGAISSGTQWPDGGTSGQIEACAEVATTRRRIECLRRLPSSYCLGAFLLVHGSPRNPLTEYVFPEDVYNVRKMRRLFERFDSVCFHGHTHIPGIITESLRFLAPNELEMEFALSDEKVMINVGSVGQPRDGDDRACYVILEDRRSDDELRHDSLGLMAARSTKVLFRRVSHDSRPATARDSRV
jgi:predicted phosphodiesterase